MTEQAPWRTSFEPQSVEGTASGLVLFDGVCVLCSGWIKFVLTRDAEAQFQFVSIFGRTESCFVPTSEQRSRFLDLR